MAGDGHSSDGPAPARLVALILSVENYRCDTACQILGEMEMFDGTGLLIASGVVVEQGSEVTTEAGANGLVVWLTGLSGAGKSTIAKEVYRTLLERRKRARCLDSDVLRSKLNSDLGFSHADREENVRRLGFIAQVLAQRGYLVLVAAISPYRSGRGELRQRVGRFMEVFVNSPLEICEKRDVKGLYKKARSGQLSHFTGIEDPYEAPLSPELECYTDHETVEESTRKVLNAMARVLGPAAF